MSLSASLSVNTAAAPAGASPDVPQGVMPDGGVSVFDILLQQIAAENPAQPMADAAPVAKDDLAAALVATDLKTETSDADAVPQVEQVEQVEIEVAAAAAQMPVAIITPPPPSPPPAPTPSPAPQPQANAAEAAPELSQPAIAIDVKTSKSRPEAKFVLPATDAKETDDAKGPEAIKGPETIETAVKDVAALVRDVARAAPKDVLSKVRDAVAGTDPQPVQPAADPRTVSAAAPDVSSSVQPSAFSLQAISDTSGSYSATGASTTAGSNMSKAAVETLSAMSMQISKKLEQGNTKFAIELYPADLGKVEVSLHIARDGKTTAHLTFDSPVTAASFSASEPELRQQLANAGLSVDKDALSFSSREGGNGFGSGMAQDQNKDQQNQQSQARHASRAMEAARKVADDSDLNAALNTAMHAMRTGASTLALNLIV